MIATVSTTLAGSFTCYDIEVTWLVMMRFQLSHTFAADEQKNIDQRLLEENNEKHEQSLFISSNSMHSGASFFFHHSPHVILMRHFTFYLTIYM